MTLVAVSFVAGGVVSAVLWRLLAPVFAHEVLARTNVNGRPVPTAGGLVVVLAPLAPAVVLPLTIWIARGQPSWIPDEAIGPWNLYLVAMLGFGLLGVVDDLLGDGSSRGFAGHLAALRAGTLTTGGLKLFGGGVLALYLATHAPGVMLDRWVLVVDAVLIALAANLANLLDRAPGRVTKVSLVLLVPLLVAVPLSIDGPTGSPGWPPIPAVFVVGAAAGVLAPELRERLMLGDTGANALGAALGLAVVLGGLSPVTRLGVAVVLLALNLLSERVSFSAVIASTPGLRHLDEWGRPTA